MFNVKDLVKYRNAMNPHENWGVVVEILIVKDSVKQETKGVELYRVNPLDTRLGYDFIEEKDIIQAFSQYYEKNND